MHNLSSSSASARMPEQSPCSIGFPAPGSPFRFAVSSASAMKLLTSSATFVLVLFLLLLLLASAVAFCNDGVREASEECDDGNGDNADG